MQRLKLTPVLLLLMAALAGCQSREVIHYTSPEVTGRVLAADTHQPLSGVSVQRVAPANVRILLVVRFAQGWDNNDGTHRRADGCRRPVCAEQQKRFCHLHATGWYSVR